VPKLDELCVLIETYKPHILCIVETWLCSDITDNEVTIPGFQLYRLDRNRHGGGILMYISDKLTVCHLPAIVQDHNLEFLPLSVRILDHKFCIAVFYRPPSAPSNIFDTSFQCIDISQFLNFYLVSDFNVNMSDPSHPLYHKVCNLMDSFSLSQVVTGHTHTSPTGRDSLIDLGFISNPSLLCTCNVIPPLANSDHYGVHTIFNLKSSASTFTSQRPRKVWCYAHVDFSKACHLISDTDWNSIISDNIDHSWMQWQERFLAIMEECIPRKVLPPRHNLPWLNKGIIQSIRRRNNLFKRARILQRTKADTNELEIELYLRYAMQKGIIFVN